MAKLLSVQIVALFLLVSSALATSTIPQLDLGSTVVIKGTATATVTLTLTNPAGISLSAVGTTIQYDPTLLGPPSISAGPAALAAQKGVSGNVDPTDSRFYLVLVSALNENPIGEGEVATLTFPLLSANLSGKIPLGNVGPNGSDTSVDSNLVEMTGASGSIAVGGPGDCDGSGTVTISEVQTALRMFLGLQLPAACVDTDGNGTVTVREAQKVVNGFLGL